MGTRLSYILEMRFELWEINSNFLRAYKYQFDKQLK